MKKQSEIKHERSTFSEIAEGLGTLIIVALCGTIFCCLILALIGGFDFAIHHDRDAIKALQESRGSDKGEIMQSVGILQMRVDTLVSEVQMQQSEIEDLENRVQKLENPPVLQTNQLLFQPLIMTNISWPVLTNYFLSATNVSPNVIEPN